MSGPNAPPVNNMPKILPMGQTNKPMGAERIEPSPRVTNTPIRPVAPPPMAGPVPMPRPRPQEPSSGFAGRFDQSSADLAAAGSPMLEAIGRRMVAGGLPVQQGPSREENFDRGKQMLAMAMAGRSLNPPKEPTYTPPVRGAPTTGSQQIGETTYGEDPNAKFDKKGRPKDVPLKSNTSAKGHNLRLYQTLGDPSNPYAANDPAAMLRALVKKAKDTPWLINRAEDKILATIGDDAGRNLSIEPGQYEARAKAAELQRQGEAREAAEADYDKMAGKREKLEAHTKNKAERKAQREKEKAEKKAKETESVLTVDPAVQKAMDALNAKGVPTWQGGKMPTQKDVNQSADAPVEFAQRFPDYKPQKTEEGEE